MSSLLWLKQRYYLGPARACKSAKISVGSMLSKPPFDLDPKKHQHLGKSTNDCIGGQVAKPQQIHRMLKGEKGENVMSSNRPAAATAVPAGGSPAP